jgi:hypothetical protein
MAAKKNNTLIYLAIGAAVIGYLYYKKGLVTPAPGSTSLPSTTTSITQNMSAQGIALEGPSPDLLQDQIFSPASIFGPQIAMD